MRDKKEELFLLLTLFFIPIGLAFLLSAKIVSLQSIKYIIMASPAYYIILAGGINSLKSKKVSLFLLVSIALLCSYSLKNYYQHSGNFREDWKEVADYVTLHSKKKDIILFDAGYMRSPFDYYYRGNLPRHGLLSREGLKGDEVSPEVKEVIEGYERVWLILSHNWRTKDFYRELMSSHYLMSGKKEFLGVKIYLYQTYQERARPDE